MQKEYKEAMEKISLSEADKERILKNVKQAYENSSDTVVSISGRPRFFARRWSMVAAAFLVVVASALVIRTQLWKTEKDKVSPGTNISELDSVVWEDLDSVEDIAKETDCKTYTLSNVSKRYQVEKVQVAKKQKHVKITYENKKEEDTILLEYKEEENAPEVTGQFEQEKELTTEKVGDTEVTLYGEKDCKAMTWQKESCTFAVTMKKGCSRKKAVKLVSGTKEKKHKKEKDKHTGKREERKVSKNAVGWTGKEETSTARERKKILNKIYELYGFRVTIEDPATKVSYKIVEGFESFQFCYPEVPDFENHRIIGYAGVEGSPAGSLDGFDVVDTLFVNGLTVSIYEDDEREVIYTFTMKTVAFTLLIGEVEADDSQKLISGIMSAIHISLDDGNSEEEETVEEAEEEKNYTAKYREQAQKIQYAVAEGNLKKISAYMEFPLSLKGTDVTVASAKEFQELDPELIFAGEWVDSVVSYDTSRIDTDTKSFVMGNDTNAIVCKIKNNSVVITELRIYTSEWEATPTPEAE